MSWLLFPLLLVFPAWTSSTSNRWEFRSGDGPIDSYKFVSVVNFFAAPSQTSSKYENSERTNGCKHLAQTLLVQTPCRRGLQRHSLSTVWRNPQSYIDRNACKDGMRLSRRRAALILMHRLATAVLTFGLASYPMLHSRPAHAITVAPPPTLEEVEVKSMKQQMNEAITIKTMRGVWKLREYDRDGKLLSQGTLTFRGRPFGLKGVVTYSGEAQDGTGPWILKADGFGRNEKGGVGGVIEQKALWKLRRGKSGAFAYSGRVDVKGVMADSLDARIEGNIVELVNGGKPKGGTEKKVGRFEAYILRELNEEEDMASKAPTKTFTLE